MIRRKARLITPEASGYVVELLKKVAATGDETAVYVHENSASFLTTEQPISNIVFEDGSPEVILEID